jgi:hypothetical protein
MKKILITAILITGIFTTTYSQNEFGIKAGLSSYDLAYGSIASTSDLKLNLKEANYGFHAGVYGRLGLFGVYLQPEIIFNSSKFSYNLNDLTTADSIEDIRTSRYQNIDVPVLVMITPSIFKLYGGPVGHYFLNNISDLKKNYNIKEEIEKFRFGYQFGAGITLKGLTIDLRYEGNFSKYYKTFTIDGVEYKADDSPSRVLVSLWFAL